MHKAITFAAPQERFLAHMIDSIAMFVISSALITLLQGGEQLAMLAPFFVGLVYFTYFQTGRWQASPGMRVVGIHLVSLRTGRCIQRDIVIRYLAFMAPMYPLYVSFLPDVSKLSLFLWLLTAWMTTMFFRPDKATVHDMLSHTRVVRGRM